MEKRETFEEYGIKIPYRRSSGNVKCVCPNCKNSGRTHPEDKSLSVSLDTGVWHCHYCGWSGGLKGYEGRRIHMKKSYRRPTPIQEHGLSQKVINYFSLRGISKETLEKMHIAEGMEFMPQVGKEMNTIQFPFYLEGELINVKYRTGDKKFKLTSGAELIPYNIDGIKDKEEAVIVEGECFDDKAQVLTTEGWKLFEELKEDDRVAQWDGGVITFAKPLAKIKKPYKGDLIEIANERRNYYSLTTPKHNLVTYRNGRYKKMHAEDIRSQISVPRTGFYDGPGLPYSDEYIRLLIAISADFTIRRKGDIYGCLKKQRKIDRIKWLLDKVGVRYSLNIDNRGYSSVFIHRGEIKDAFKEFPVEWISLVSARQAQIILEEIVLWDGNCVKGRTMKEYSTKLYHNAVWVQTLCHLAGMCSTICYRENEVGAWYKVTMLFKSTSTIKKEYKRGVPYNGFVYCCTMPAGTLLVRQNDIITVSGNCDALSFIEAGIDNVVSVPNGANKNLDWLDDFLEGWFDDKRTIYIAVDNDEKGIELKDELVRRFGAERCMIVSWSKGCKDANDQLKEFGKESLQNCVKGAREVKVGGIYGVEDYESELDNVFVHGLQRGKVIGHDNFDRLVSFETKRLMVVTGVPGCLDGDSAVLMSDGTTKPIRDVQVGDDVMALDKYYRLVTRPVVTKWDSGEKECYKLTTNMGRTLIATGDHKILSFDGMKPLKELEVGEFIGSAGNYNSCLWEQVKSIEPVGVRHTYDIQVAIDHNFVADNLIVKNSGKSEFIDEMVVRLNIRYGWKAAFFSPENLPLHYHASKLIEKLTGKKFEQGHMSEEEYAAAKQHISANFMHILPEGKYTLEAILEKAQFLVRRKGIKVLVIDPYNRIESDIGSQSETNYISKILDQLTNFAQRNDVLVCLMAHPRKINKSENADGIPTFYDINGSANFYNKADFGLIVHRNRDEGYTLVRVAKVKFRHLGESGDALFKYNTENGRYVPYVEGLPVVFDNRSFIMDEAQEQPVNNYDFTNQGDEYCPF